MSGGATVADAPHLDHHILLRQRAGDTAGRRDTHVLPLYYSGPYPSALLRESQPSGIQEKRQWLVGISRT